MLLALVALAGLQRRLGIGLVWVFMWWPVYRRPQVHPRVTERVIGALMTPSVFEALGVNAMLGTYCPRFASADEAADKIRGGVLRLDLEVFVGVGKAVVNFTEERGAGKSFVIKTKCSANR